MNDDLVRTKFPHLSGDDMATMLGLASPCRYTPGDTIITKGSEDHRIIIIRSGFVRVERNHGDVPIALARLGPGDILGEMSFIESGGATADVRADTVVEADVIAGTDLATLLTSDPGFSARFHRSLALMLSKRLQETSGRLSELSAFAKASGDEVTPQTDQVSDRQLPSELLRRTRALTDRMRMLEEQASAGEDVTGAVGSTCDEMLNLFGEITDGASLLEIAFDDLLAFRKAEQVGHGIGGWLFREFYPFLMASSTIARIHIRPRGIADDFETTDLIHQNIPHGDGVLGPLVDRWFLDRPLCRSRRNIRTMMVEKYTALLVLYPGSSPVEITGLATASQGEIFAVLSAMTDRQISVTCIDSDEQALVALGARARRLGHFEKMRLVNSELLLLVRGIEHLALAPQTAIWAIGVGELLDDAANIDLLNWAYTRLDTGGTFTFSNVHDSNQDQFFLEHMLDSPLRHRDESELTELVARSSFDEKNLTIECDDSGANMLASCTKA